MNATARQAELRAFLTDRRARLNPQDVGLPAFGRRRVPGLRREDVAELVGVSPNWYAFFEKGTTDRRFSPAFVQRVADALRLDDRERAVLFRLALPEVAAAAEHFERSARDGALQSLAKVREFSRRVTAISSFEEGAIAVVETIQGILLPSCATVANLVGYEAPPKSIAVGPKGEFAMPIVAKQFITVNYPNPFGRTTFNENRPRREETAGGSFAFRQNISDGRAFTVHVVASSAETLDKTIMAPRPKTQNGEELNVHDVRLDADEFWTWNALFGSRAALIHGLFENGMFLGDVVALWSEPHKMSSLEIEVAQAISAILELAASGSEP